MGTGKPNESLLVINDLLVTDGQLAVLVSVRANARTRQT